MLCRDCLKPMMSLPGLPFLGCIPGSCAKRGNVSHVLLSLYGSPASSFIPSLSQSVAFPVCRISRLAFETPQHAISNDALALDIL